uniref:Uncharacterized protein n=1 Tax=Arundo donax TaxID=35708 RepID=A0A0A9B7G1_ARUDO
MYSGHVTARYAGFRPGSTASRSGATLPCGGGPRK